VIRAGQGLTELATEDLERLLRAIHRGNLQCPLGPAGIAGIGLQDAQATILGHLRTLDERAVRAVLVAVIAERRRD
jgi:hypothetical protein